MNLHHKRFNELFIFNQSTGYEAEIVFFSDFCDTRDLLFTCAYNHRTANKNLSRRLEKSLGLSEVKFIGVVSTDNPTKLDDCVKLAAAAVEKRAKWSMRKSQAAAKDVIGEICDKFNASSLKSKPKQETVDLTIGEDDEDVSEVESDSDFFRECCSDGESIEDCDTNERILRKLTKPPQDSEQMIKFMTKHLWDSSDDPDEDLLEFQETSTTQLQVELGYAESRMKESRKKFDKDMKQRLSKENESPEKKPKQSSTDTRELFKPRFSSDSTTKPKVPVESSPKFPSFFNEYLFGHHSEAFTDPTASTPQLGRGIDPKEGITFNLKRKTKRLSQDRELAYYNSKLLGAKVPKFNNTKSSSTKLSFSTSEPIHQAPASTQIPTASTSGFHSRSLSVRGRRPINDKPSNYKSTGELPQHLKEKINANMVNMDRDGSPTYSPRSSAKPLGRHTVPPTIKDAIDGDEDVIEIDEVIDLEAEENNNGKRKMRQLQPNASPKKFGIFRSKNGRSQGAFKR
jgi:hypothetical protein